MNREIVVSAGSFDPKFRSSYSRKQFSLNPIGEKGIELIPIYQVHSLTSSRQGGTGCGELSVVFNDGRSLTGTVHAALSDEISADFASLHQAKELQYPTPTTPDDNPSAWRSIPKKDRLSLTLGGPMMLLVAAIFIKAIFFPANATQKEQEAREKKHSMAAAFACERYARAKANYPATVDFSFFGSLKKERIRHNTWKITSTFTAKNAFGVEGKYGIHCSVQDEIVVEAEIWKLI